MSIIDAGWYKWFSYLVVAVLLLLATALMTIVVFDLIPAQDPQARGWLIGLLVLFMAFAAWGGYDVLGYPTRIVVHPDGGFELHSPLRVLRLSPAQVSEVACDSDGDWYLRHAGKKVDLRFFRAAQLAGFVKGLQVCNPAISNR